MTRTNKQTDAGKLIRSEIADFRKKLKAGANPERAVNEKRYLKSPFRFYGVSLPFTEKLAKEFAKKNRNSRREHLFDLVHALWSSDYHEEKRLAIQILEQFPEHIDFGAMPMLEAMLTESTGWDLVDAIAIHLVGTVLGKDKRAYQYLRTWSRSDNFWMRRASLISQILLFREKKGDTKLFFRFAERMIGEKEFFIRKAIGWGLREMSKTDPDAVVHFLMSVRGRVSGLTLREGIKRLSDDRKALFLPAHDRCLSIRLTGGIEELA